MTRFCVLTSGKLGALLLESRLIKDYQRRNVWRGKCSMSCANTNLPEFMMRNHIGRLPVSQKIHFQIGHTPKHTISFFRSISYTIILIKLPNTTDFLYMLSLRRIHGRSIQAYAHAQRRGCWPQGKCPVPDDTTLQQALLKADGADTRQQILKRLETFAAKMCCRVNSCAAARWRNSTDWNRSMW